MVPGLYKLCTFIHLIPTFRILKSVYGILIFTLTFAPAILVAQQGVSVSRFDALYSRAMQSLARDTVAATKILKWLSADTGSLSDLHRARISYLQMKIREQRTGEDTQGGRPVFPLPATLKSPDSMRYYADRYLERSMPDRAIALLMKALDRFSPNSDAADRVKLELCEAYRQKQEYLKGIDLISSLLERATPLSLANRAYAYSRLAALYNEWGQPPGTYTDSVFKYSLRCQQVALQAGDLPMLAASRNELSFQYMEQGDYDKALGLSQRAVIGFLSAGMPFHAMNALLNQSLIYLRKDDYDAALGVLGEATRLAPVWENRNLYMRIYKQFAAIHEQRGEYHDACGFLTLCNHLQVEFFKDRINNQITDQAARYDLLIKEQKIRQEQKKNQFRRNQIIFLAIISITLSLAFLFSLFYFRLRRKEALRQKLAEAVLETETNERRRIARDLHAGLGPVLSAINHYFQAFLDAKPATREEIRNRLQMVITEAIDEVSKISHNISPHVLEKHGLDTALNNLFAPLTTAGCYEISYNCDCRERFDPKVELTVYRCIAELLNNTMKHAAATRISLDVRHRGDRLTIAFADNGSGFDSALAKKTGMGLHNITNRVESSGGSLLLASAPGTGTSVTISIPL